MNKFTFNSIVVLTALFFSPFASSENVWVRNVTSEATLNDFSSSSPRFIMIKSLNSGGYLRDKGEGNSSLGAGVDELNGTRYIWAMKPNGDGSYSFRNLGTKRYLSIGSGDVHVYSRTNNSLTQEEKFSTGSAENASFGNDYFLSGSKLYGYLTRRCASVSGGGDVSKKHGSECNSVAELFRFESPTLSLNYRCSYVLPQQFFETGEIKYYKYDDQDSCIAQGLGD